MSRKKTWRCPICKEMTTDYPAISRRDNKTEICSKCGTVEALTDWQYDEVLKKQAKNKNRLIN